MIHRDEIVTYLRRNGVDILVYVLIPNPHAGVVRLALGTTVVELKAVAELLNEHPDVTGVLLPKPGEPIIQFSLSDEGARADDHADER